MTRVYIGMSLDTVHHGHANIIEKAARLGDVVIGLLTDRAIADHKRMPVLRYAERKRIAERFKGVVEVVQQKEWSYAPNLRKYKPDIMVHGDDWIEGPLAPHREEAISALNEYGGKLVEVPYTKDISCSEMTVAQRRIGTTPDIRRRSLKRLLAAKSVVRVIEAHSPLSGLIAENAMVEQDGKRVEFDCMWSSSLTDSTEMGKPDIEALEISQRLANINNIFDVTTKPMIMDADTGGKVEHLELNIKSIERLGVSAVIIEDKTGLKKNSLLGNDVEQTQEDPLVFASKIRCARASRVSDEFMVIARIESLILDKGIEDALNRAKIYADAGVDGIMIHSRKKDTKEIKEFAERFREMSPALPLVAVPTSYNKVKEDELAGMGFNVVIYANHLLRASYKSMDEVARMILENGRSMEADNKIISIAEILKLIPGTD